VEPTERIRMSKKELKGKSKGVKKFTSAREAICASTIGFSADSDLGISTVDDSG
jgi:hypothetical protein